MEYKKYRESINEKLNELYEQYPKIYQRIEEVSILAIRDNVIIYFDNNKVMLDITAHYTRMMAEEGTDLTDFDLFCEELELFLLENSVRRRKTENE